MVVDKLYYGETSCNHHGTDKRENGKTDEREKPFTRSHVPTFTQSAEQGFSFNMQTVADAIRRIYERDFNPLTELDEALFNETWQVFNQATDEALTPPLWGGAGGEVFLNELKYNNAVFSAFRTHRLQGDIADQLLDENGKLKPFEQFSNDVQPIATHNVKHWLQTEYNTAVLRAHNAAAWKQFEKDRDILPNLRWMPTTSVTPDVVHKQFWESRLTLPQDHPFWERYHPQDRWNCKCYLEATSDPVNGEHIAAEHAPAPYKPAPGLDNNPAKDGQLFSDSHPYNPPSCAACTLPGKKRIIPENKSLLRFFASTGKKDCYHCSKPVELLKKAGVKTPAKQTAEGRKREALLESMLPLLKKSVIKKISGDKAIKIIFKASGNEHIVNDYLKYVKGFRKKQLANLDTLLRDSEFVKPSDLHKDRSDNIQRFYYFKDREKEIYYHVAEEVFRLKNGKIMLNRFLYALTNRIIKK